MTTVEQWKCRGDEWGERVEDRMLRSSGVSAQEVSELASCAISARETLGAIGHGGGLASPKEWWAAQAYVCLPLSVRNKAADSGRLLRKTICCPPADLRRR
jgi:hypothetical protein